MINHFLIHLEFVSRKEYYDIDYYKAQFFSIIYNYFLIKIILIDEISDIRVAFCYVYEFFTYISCSYRIFISCPYIEYFDNSISIV